MVSGLTFDGGYADYMIAPAEAIASVPEVASGVWSTTATLYLTNRTSGASTSLSGTLENGGTGNNINLGKVSAGTSLAPTVVECEYVGTLP
jgi:hypothetical protein